jgi:hypothetical protein
MSWGDGHQRLWRIDRSLGDDRGQRLAMSALVLKCADG